MNIYSTHPIYFEYQDGTKIIGTVRIDREQLGKIAYQISKNKRMKGKRGAIQIVAKQVIEPAIGEYMEVAWT